MQGSEVKGTWGRILALPSQLGHLASYFSILQVLKKGHKITRLTVFAVQWVTDQRPNEIT